MTDNDKVVWSEGMFLRPQHFQQHDRYIENRIEARCVNLRPYAWGLTEVQIDEDLLSLGKFALTACRGILPDGTPFAIGEDDGAPAVLDVPKEAKNAVIYLALPARRIGTIETGNGDAHSLARHTVSDIEVRDSNTDAATGAAVQTGRLHLRLLLESQDRSAYVCLGVGRIIEKKADGQIVLDGEYISPCLECRTSARLSGFLTELNGLLRHRGEELAVRIAEPGRGGVAEIADFLLLQIINRYEPLFLHLGNMTGVHPELFYRIAIQVAGELATFTADNKRPAELPPYLHDALKETFVPVMANLRLSLGMVLEQKATLIPLQEHKFGIRVAEVSDRTLFSTAVFVLAVNAKVSPEALRSHFPSEVKIGPVEKIRDLVNLHLSGVRLRLLPVAPRQIPYHAGFTYFELDRTGELWKELDKSGRCAFHIAGDYPGLELEFWAIRE